MVNKSVFCILGLFLFAVFTVSFASAVITSGSFTQMQITNPDNFFSPSEQWLNISVNVTPSGGAPDVVVVNVLANFTSINATACNGSGYLNLTKVNNLWVGNCSVATFLTNTSQMTPLLGNISFIGTDFSVLGGNVYTTDVSIGPLFILMHNLGVPSMQDPTNCSKFGPKTTNMSLVRDFARVNFVVQVQVNFTCQTSGLYNGTNFGIFEDVLLMNLTSVNMTQSDIGDKLAALKDAINVTISRPRTFDPSRIYVNSTAFAALNTSGNITLYNLPFASKPNVLADSGYALQNLYWYPAGYSPAKGISIGNLTFDVTSFSGYNATDTVSPLINITSPLGINVSSTTTNIVFSVLVNGTGTEPSYISIANITGGNPYVYNGSLGGVRSANCISATAINETYNCTVVFPVANLSEGTNTVTVTAYDFGGSAGNVNTTTRSFTVDRTGPTITIKSPGVSSYTNATSVLFNISVTDDSTSVSNCWVYINGSVYPMTNLSSGYFNYTNSSIAVGVWTVNNFTCNDTLGNSGNTSSYTFTVDRTVPAIPNVTTGTPNAGGVTIYYTTNESLSLVNISYGTGSSFGSSYSETSKSASSSMGITGLSAGTPYYYNITVCDLAGNCATNGTFSFTTAASSTDDGTGGTGGTTTNNALSYWYATYSFDSDKFKAGFNWDLQNHYRLKVPVDGESHYVGVVGLTNTSVTVNVTSTPQQAILSIGQFKKFDVNDDYVYDMIVTLNSITGNRANLAIKALNETMTAQEKAAVVAAKAATNTTAVQNLTTPGARAEKTGGSNWLLWTVLVIVILLAAAGAVYYFYLRKMKNLGYK